MPLDPNIPLSIRPPQFADPLEQYGKVLGLRNLIQQGQLHQQQQQLGQQQIEHGALALKQQQMDVADQEKYRQAWQDSGGDLTKARMLAVKAGVGPKLLVQVDSELTKHAEAVAKLDETQLKNHKTRTEAFHDALSGIASQPDPAKQQSLWNASTDRLVKDGVLRLSEAQPYPGPEGVAALLAQTTTQKQLLDIAEEKRKQAEEEHKAKMRPLQEQETGAKALKEESEATMAGLKLQGREPEQPHERAMREQLEKHQVATEKIQKLRLAVAEGRLKQEQMINGMKYGPGTQEYWVKQLQENPDSIKEMPAEFRSVVGQKFKAETGLPLPTALSATTQAQETAARNALDGIEFMKKALDNPEIRRNIGPIMGRLGNIEQRLGNAVHLSPEAEALAQELRTRMRYFVFQEGKAILGGRLPQQLMKALEESSANVKMDPGMLRGAIAGAEGNAQSVLDNADKQRFGGKMRPRLMRGTEKPSASGPTVGTVEDGYKFKGGDPSKPENWEKVP